MMLLNLLPFIVFYSAYSSKQNINIIYLIHKLLRNSNKRKNIQIINKVHQNINSVYLNMYNE